MKGIPAGKKPSVGTGAGDSPARNVAGGPGRSFEQKPIPGPTSPGQPIAMKKALARKTMPSKGL